MVKIFWFDVETTGLDCKNNEIIQLACIVEIDGVVKTKKNWKIKPTNFDNISQESLDITGLTIEQLKEFPESKVIFDELIEFLDFYIDKYDRDDKFMFGAYNGNFDIDFLKQFFIRNNHSFFGSYFNYRLVDPLPILRWLSYLGKLPNLENHKLVTVANYFNIEINAHDALSDIEATKVIACKLEEFIK